MQLDAHVDAVADGGSGHGLLDCPAEKVTCPHLEGADDEGKTVEKCA